MDHVDDAVRNVGVSAAETMDALQAGLTEPLRAYVGPIEAVTKEIRAHGLNKQAALSMLIGFAVAAVDEEYEEES